METQSVIIEKPGSVALRSATLTAPGKDDLVVDVRWSGISTGTERLLWQGRMPHFPGMGYPLVPGYESVGIVSEAPSGKSVKTGDWVFVPGAACHEGARSLFGGASQKLVVSPDRVVTVDPNHREDSILYALAATAHRAVTSGSVLPQLIIGHGVLGRLLARITIALGGEPPTVWETNTDRMMGAGGYEVVDPSDDPRRDYAAVYDASGDASLIDTLVARLAPGGELVLAGFYETDIRLAFIPAFMREIRLRISAEFKDPDLRAARNLVRTGKLSLSGLISHRQPADSVGNAYRIATEDPACLKMILDWSNPQ